MFPPVRAFPNVAERDGDDTVSGLDCGDSWTSSRCHHDVIINSEYISTVYLLPALDEGGRLIFSSRPLSVLLPLLSHVLSLELHFA